MKPKEAVCMVASNSVECEITPIEFVQDLLVLLIEGRVPEVSEHGRKEGAHCWPITNDSRKNCCTESRKMEGPSLCNLVADVRHTTSQVANDYKSIVVEVFASLDSSQTSSNSLQMCHEQNRIFLNHLDERNKYILIEKWKIELVQHSQIGGKARLITMQLLLQAVRSFLHFSQLSAWLISSQGLNPSCISYKISKCCEPTSMPFIRPEEIHVFPLTDISKDLFARITSFSLPRISYRDVLEEDVTRTLAENTVILSHCKQTSCMDRMRHVDSKSGHKHHHEHSGSSQPLEDIRYCNGQTLDSCQSVTNHSPFQGPDEAFRACRRKIGTTNDGPNLDKKTNHGSLLTQCLKNNAMAITPDPVTTYNCHHDNSRTNCSKKFHGCNVQSCQLAEIRDHAPNSEKSISDSLASNSDYYSSLLDTQLKSSARTCLPGLSNTPPSANSKDEKSTNLEDGVHKTLSKVEENMVKNLCSPSMNFYQFHQDLTRSDAKIEDKNDCEHDQYGCHGNRKEDFYPSHTAYFQGEIDDDIGITFVTKSPKNTRTSCNEQDTSNGWENNQKDRTTADSTSLINGMEDLSLSPSGYGKCHCRSKSASTQITSEWNKNYAERQRPKSSFPRLSIGACTVPVFHKKTNLPINSSPAPLRRPESQVWTISGHRDQETDSELSDDHSSPLLLSKSAPASTSLLGNFEESMLKGRMPAVGRVEGFSIVLGASGSFCPRQMYLPVKAHFFSLSDDDAPSPYLGYVRLKDSVVGKKGYHIPRHGTVQVTLFNPHKTVVKVFVVLYNYDDMPYNSQTFLRQRIVSVMADGDEEEQDVQQSLHYLIHLRFRCSKHGRLYLHTDIRVIFPQQTPDIPPGFRLRTLTDGPSDPKYTPMNS